MTVYRGSRQANAVAMIVRAVDTGRILVQRRGYHMDEYPLAFEIPQGHAEEGEDPRETAIRELYEETGFLADVDSLEYLGDIYSDDGRFRVAVYLVPVRTAFRPDPMPGFEWEIQGAWWLYPHEAAEYIFNDGHPASKKALSLWFLTKEDE